MDQRWAPLRENDQLLFIITPWENLETDANRKIKAQN